MINTDSHNMMYHGLTPCFLLWLFKHNIDNHERRIIIRICSPLLNQVPRVSEINWENRSQPQSKKHVEPDMLLFTKLSNFLFLSLIPRSFNSENPSQHCRDVSPAFCPLEKPKLHLNWFSYESLLVQLDESPRFHSLVDCLTLIFFNPLHPGFILLCGQRA